MERRQRFLVFEVSFQVRSKVAFLGALKKLRFCNLGLHFMWLFTGSLSLCSYGHSQAGGGGEGVKERPIAAQGERAGGF